jgi:signal transduction histidine kinase
MLFKNKYISIPFNESNLTKRNQRLAFILEMSNFLSMSRSLEELLGGALIKVLEHFDLDAGRIYLMDEECRNLSLVAHCGIDSGGFEKLSINEGFSGKSVRTQSFIAQHVSELVNKERAAFLSSKGFKIIICVPLISINKVGGVMNLASREVISLDREKIDVFTAVGSQIAIAANNAKLHEELKAKIETLKEKKELIEFFAYSVSHDLKSPASGLYALTKRFLENYGTSLDKKGRVYCDQILKTAEHIITMVNDTNEYIISKETPLNLERFKFREITESIRNEFSNRLEQRHIRWSEPEILPEITGDKLALLRVFRNLTENTLKYGGEKLSQINVGYEEDEAFHVFSFNDNGVGVKEEDREMIFEIFQRNETSRRISGSGLGLAIVKEVAARHKGETWMADNGGKGASFFVSISKDLELMDEPVIINRSIAKKGRSNHEAV